MDTDKEEMLLRICRMYYEQNVSQDVIAHKFHLSRSYISKLLKEAMQIGLVEIRIKDSLHSESDIERRIRERFGLKKVIVVPVATPLFEKKLEVIGSMVGRYLNSILSDDDIIGVSWGMTLAACADRLIKKDLKGVVVTQLKGGLPHIDEVGRTNDIVRQFAEAFDAETHFLPLPLIVDSVEIKDAIVKDSKVQEVLKLGLKANIVLFAVGEFGLNSSLVRAGYFSKAEVSALRERGVVGDACGRLIDIDGKIVSNEFDARTIGIPLDQLRTKEYSILVTAESNSVRGAYGVLNGRYANVIIADEYSAKEILALDAKLGGAHA
ncbi:MAG TPA: sugar-binding transcriptional regulator [Spirochaetales bacterium]|nr:sugar-binding transcriptional regulator [Spirochaetales bacterium]HRY56016.1 sugar-binding transcriptional regulator [Spirochaetia bacterium]